MPLSEGNGLAPLGRQQTQHLGHGLGDGSGSLAGRSEGNEDAGVAFVEGEDGMPIGSEEHQVGLPVARGASVIGG